MYGPVRPLILFAFPLAAAAPVLTVQPPQGPAPPAETSKTRIPPRPSGGPTTAHDDSVAEFVARDAGITLAQARERLEIIDEAMALRARLLEAEADSLGDVYVQHQPVFGVIVSFTDRGDERLARHEIPARLRSVIQVRPARHAKRERVASLRAALTTLAAAGISANAYIDHEVDEIVIVTPQAEDVEARRRGGRLNLPADVRLRRGARADRTQASAPSGRFPPQAGDHIAPGHFYYNAYTDGSSAPNAPSASRRPITAVAARSPRGIANIRRKAEPTRR